MRISVNNLMAPEGSTERNTVLEALRLGFTDGVNETLAAIWENPNGGITVNLWGSFVVRCEEATSLLRLETSKGEVY